MTNIIKDKIEIKKNIYIYIKIDIQIRNSWNRDCISHRFPLVLAGNGDEMEDVECGNDGCQTHGLENQACLPIPIPQDDKVFGGKQKPCLMFVRSLQVPNAYTCELCT